MIFNTKKNKGFTLIELLVVVAIIGILASVVLASLNSARQKGQAAAIKSGLRNMVDQAEISYSDNGSYAGFSVNNNTDTTCAGGLANIAKGFTNVKCLSYYSAGLQDYNTRWGATGIIYSATAPVQAWSATSAGVVTWDAKGVNTDGTFVTGNDISTMNWDQANAACTTSGGRLPTLEELKTLSDAYYAGSNNTSYTPPGFNSGANYWSSTTVPSNSAAAYYVYLTTGAISTLSKTSPTWPANTRCVR